MLNRLNSLLWLPEQKASRTAPDRARKRTRVIEALRGDRAALGGGS
jgi:hypothetical protein